MKKYILLSLTILAFTQRINAQSEDPYLWLEDIDGKKSSEFVDRQNKITIGKLGQKKEYQSIYAKSLEIYNSIDRIVYPTTHGEFVYNFWQDKDHVRGIWRRTPKVNYINGNPAWETLLDIDELSKKDNIEWVYKGAAGLYPKYNRFIIYLSNGGGDASVKREFDADTRSFVENGFYMDAAKEQAEYVDENTLIVSIAAAKGTMTTSGYSRQVKLWKRGTLLKDARLIHEGDTTDVVNWGYIMRDGPVSYVVVMQVMTFYKHYTYIWMNNALIKLDIPDDSEKKGLLNDQLILHLKSDWTANGKTYRQGSLVSVKFSSLLKGQKEIELILQPDEFTSVDGVSSTKNKLLVSLLTNVKSELYIYQFTNGNWEASKVSAPDFGTISIEDTDEFSDQYFFSFTNFLIPSTLFYADARDNRLKPFQSLPAYFDATRYKVEQYKVRSTDGTPVPYFVVSSKAMEYNKKNPVLLDAYGGFEVSDLPYYLRIEGNAWLENGGVFVLANLRGGGEFGPKWHQAGVKEKRQNVYDDFHSVAEDLIAKKITSSNHLGIAGGSNGGLLVGVAFTQRPDLYNAVVCQVPLLDMKRYNKLLAGASWMGEYGDPDKPEEWEYIRKYSPYQNLKKGAKYPEVLFITSTRDDRVHPGHARKMAAKMIDMGYPVYYYENTEGGHAGSSTNEQRARWAAIKYSYLLMKLKD